MRTAALLALISVFGLSACNSTLDERTTKRIGTGAIIGGVATALVDGNPIKGAIVGGVVGGLTSKNRQIWD